MYGIWWHDWSAWFFFSRRHLPDQASWILPTWRTLRTGSDLRRSCLKKWREMGYEKATQNTKRHLYVQQEDLTVTFFSIIAGKLHCKATKQKMCRWGIYKLPWSVCLFCCRKIHGSILGIYKTTHEWGNWDWGRAILFLGLHKWDFLCSVGEEDRSR